MVIFASAGIIGENQYAALFWNGLTKKNHRDQLLGQVLLHRVSRRHLTLNFSPSPLKSNPISLNNLGVLPLP